MTDTLHRCVSDEDLGREFIVFCAMAKGINERGWGKRARQFAEICMKHSPVNIGDISQFIHGNFSEKAKAIVQNISDRSDEVKFVFTDLDSLVGVLTELREADLGISIDVTGDEELVERALRKAKLRKHSVEHSLGVRGRVERLPPRQILELTTMCGHGMVPASAVNMIINELKLGRLTAAEAADLLSIPCVCGIVNTERAAKLLEQLKVRA